MGPPSAEAQSYRMRYPKGVARVPVATEMAWQLSLPTAAHTRRKRETTHRRASQGRAIMARSQVRRLGDGHGFGVRALLIRRGLLSVRTSFSLSIHGLTVSRSFFSSPSACGASRISCQLRFPAAKGFSARNLWDMKKWYLFYASNDEASQKLEEASSALDTGSEKLRQLVAETAEEEFEEKLRQPVAELGFPSIFSFVPWGHHILIARKCATIDEALFYIRKTIDEGLSRNALDDFIRAGLYHTAGTAVTNFEQRLPKARGVIAQEIIATTWWASTAT